MEENVGYVRRNSRQNRWPEQYTRKNFAYDKGQPNLTSHLAEEASGPEEGSEPQEKAKRVVLVHSFFCRKRPGFRSATERRVLAQAPEEPLNFSR